MGEQHAREPRIGIYVSFSGAGGVERMVANLAAGMARRGVQVDLLLARARSEHLGAFPEGVRVLKLPSDHTYGNLLALRRYLVRDAPAALLAVKHRAIQTAVAARWLSGRHVPLAGRLGTHVSAALEGRGRVRRALWRLGIRAFYPAVDRLICVSEGVAEDTRRLAGLPAERTPVIRNPVVGPELPELAAQAPDHPWLAPGAPPVVLGIGRLTRQKDFATLLRAFARVRGEREVRLLILGDGGLRGELEALAAELGIARDVELPGFQKNPYAFLARAGVFVLSSIWEGSPNALAEALALGVPAVATDCPSGPREILQDGRVAPLVPMESPEALASAIIQMLDAPPPPEALQAAVAEYTVERSVARYLATLTASSDPV